MNDLKKSDLKMSSLNVRTTYHIYYFTFKLYFFVIHFYVTLTKLYSFKKHISYRPILVSPSAMTLIMYILLRSYQFRNLILTLIVENWKKNMTFLIVIFHTKYPKIYTPPYARHNFFKCDPPNFKSWIRP